METTKQPAGQRRSFASTAAGSCASITTALNHAAEYMEAKGGTVIEGRFQVILQGLVGVIEDLVAKTERLELELTALKQALDHRDEPVLHGMALPAEGNVAWRCNS